MKKTLFLIGGSGFIGKNLVKTLVSEYQITVFDKIFDYDFFSEYPQVKTVLLELDKEYIPQTFTSPDFIINLASIVTAERDLSLFDSLINSNLKILLNLYERFKNDKNLKLFIQFGSSEEYGNAKPPYKEDVREEPNSPYALVKQLTTNTALMLYRNYKFPACVVRPGNLFGPGQDNRKFIPYVINQLKNNAPLNVSPCEQKRDIISVIDFCEDIRALIHNYLECIGKIINVSNGISISLKEIIENLKMEIHSTSVINYGALPYRENEAMDLRCDINVLNEILAKERTLTRLNQLI